MAFPIELRNNTPSSFEDLKLCDFTYMYLKFAYDEKF